MTTNPLHKPARLDEEPELTQEEAIPSDGKDEEGEQMMRHVRNSKLTDSGQEASGKPDQSPVGKGD